jgi:hypothetical protein
LLLGIKLTINTGLTRKIYRKIKGGHEAIELQQRRGVVMSSLLESLFFSHHIEIPYSFLHFSSSFMFLIFSKGFQKSVTERG